MTYARAIEYRITRNLLESSGGTPIEESATGLAEKLICSVALAGVMLLFGSLLPELLAVLVAGSAVLALGGKSSN